jgi:hypothetical protein
MFVTANQMQRASFAIDTDADDSVILGREKRNTTG